MNNIFTAFMFTAIAGLSTGIGSLIALISRKTNTKFLSISLGFSAGVMIYISMIEIFPSAVAQLTVGSTPRLANIKAVAAFFIGMLLIAIIDKVIPEKDNPHDVKNPDTYEEETRNGKLMRTGIKTALALAIHNLPEGLATFLTALNNPRLAIPIVIAIAIHNIPEGISVSVPIYHATGSRRRAFYYSFASGLAEPIGALFGYLILMPFITPALQGMVNAAVAGIMVFISIDELLPSAREYGEHHLSVYGFVFGMMLMAVSLIMFM
ncbi:MAG: zinc transporter ZupT [Clostridiaceae bacterium]